MLLTPPVLSETTILDNANVLAHHWNPADPIRSRLHWSEQGKIYVFPRFPLTSDLLFTNEKTILLLHWLQIKSLAKKRSDEILAKINPTLKQGYEINLSLQGLIQLCHAYSKQLSNCIDVMKQIEKPYLENADIIVKLNTNQLNTELDQALDDTILFIHMLRATQKKRMTSAAFAILFNPLQQRLIIGASLASRAFPIEVNLDDYPNLRITAQWEQQKEWTDYTQQPVAPIVMMNFFVSQGLLPLTCTMYLSFGQKNYQVEAENAIESGKYSSDYVFRQYVMPYGYGSIPYLNRDLVMTLDGHVDILTTEWLLKYFQLAIEIGLREDCDNLVLFGPYSFSYMAYALGLYSDNNEFPNLLTQKNEVDQNFEKRKRMKLDSSLERYNMDQRLFRPFLLSLRNLHKHSIVDTENGSCSTYSQRIKEKPLLKTTEDKEFFPNFFQFSRQPYLVPSFNRLMERKSGLTLQRTGVRASQEPIDFHWLQDDKALTEIGTATHEQASTKNHYKTLMRVKGK